MTRNATDTENETEYWYQGLPVRYVVKCADEQMVKDFAENDGVSEHRFYWPARDAAHTQSRVADLPFAVWDVEHEDFVHRLADVEHQKRNGRCPVCGEEYDSRREGELTTYDHREFNPDWNADDAFSAPTRVRTCEIPCEDDPWAPDDWDLHLEIQEEERSMAAHREPPEPHAD